MPYKPMVSRKFRQYTDAVGWKIEKGSIDWNLYDELGDFLCSIKIIHGKGKKQEVSANSVRKTEKFFKKRGLVWPPKKKSKST